MDIYDVLSYVHGKHIHARYEDSSDEGDDTPEAVKLHCLSLWLHGTIRGCFLDMRRNWEASQRRPRNIYFCEKDCTYILYD